MAAGANGAVCRAKCTRGGLEGRTFALKLVFNLGNTNTAGAAFTQYEAEYNTLATLEPHRNVMRFYAQFNAPIPEDVLPGLPEFVREVATTNPATGRPWRRPLKNQWVLFEWLPETVEAWTRGRWEAGGAEMTCLPWRDVARMGLEICHGLMHLDEHRIVSCGDRVVWCSSTGVRGVVGGSCQWRGLQGHTSPSLAVVRMPSSMLTALDVDLGM